MTEYLQKWIYDLIVENDRLRNEKGESGCEMKRIENQRDLIHVLQNEIETKNETIEKLEKEIESLKRIRKGQIK